MTSGQNFWDASVWSLMIELTLLLVGMLTANMLRRLNKPLRQSLIPSAVLGGFIILLGNLGYESLFGSSLFNTVTMETLTYHGLGLGCVAVALKVTEKKDKRGAAVDVFNSGLTTVSAYLLQGVLGLGITLGLSYVIGNWAASGLLLPMGYGQGPGQAYNFGHIYETGTGYDAALGTGYEPFQYGASFGLTIAAMGFVAASIGGLIYMNSMKRKGLVRTSDINAEEVEDLSAELITTKGEIPLSESLDKLTVQIGLVFFTYMAGYVLTRLLSAGMDSLGGFFAGTVKPLVWGFNFLIGTILAIVLKKVLGTLQRKGIIHRQYLNNFMLSRIAGVMFDIMVVASIAAINLSAFTHPEFIIPLTILCVVGAVVTYFQVKFTVRRLFPHYEHEAFLSLYGMLTGTNSTGVILVREIDPLFETPAVSNLIYQQLWAIVFGFPMLLLLGFAPIGLNGDKSHAWLTMGALVILFIIINLVLFRRQVFGSRRSKVQAK